MSEANQTPFKTLLTKSRSEIVETAKTRIREVLGPFEVSDYPLITASSNSKSILVEFKSNIESFLNKGETAEKKMTFHVHPKDIPISDWVESDPFVDIPEKGIEKKSP